jgi:hypothetical protein
MNKYYYDFDPELGVLDDEKERENQKKTEEFYTRMRESELMEQEQNRKKWDELVDPNREDGFGERIEQAKNTPLFMDEKERLKRFGFFYPPTKSTSPIKFEPIYPPGLRQRRTPTSTGSTPTNEFRPISRPTTPLLPTTTPLLKTTTQEVERKKSICPPEGCNISGGIRRRRKTRKTRKSRKSKKSKRKSRRKI